MVMLGIARVLAVAGLLWPGAAVAQPRLQPPREIVIFVHRDVENVEFVDPLVCELSRTLVAPVRAQALDLPLDAGMMASATQLDAFKVAGRLRLATASEMVPGTFGFLIVPHDLTTPRFRYVFGASFGPPYSNGVVSTARLTPPEPSVRVVVMRTYKIILRYVAQLAGMWQRDGCVLAMPRSVEELDAKSAEFCDADRAMLVDAGVVKAEPGGACGPTAALR
jgi:predicted Zn-dependent protease